MWNKNLPVWKIEKENCSGHKNVGLSTWFVFFKSLENSFLFLNDFALSKSVHGNFSNRLSVVNEAN